MGVEIPSPLSCIGGGYVIGPSTAPSVFLCTRDFLILFPRLGGPSPTSGHRHGRGYRDEKEHLKEDALCGCNGPDAKWRVREREGEGEKERWSKRRKCGIWKEDSSP